MTQNWHPTDEQLLRFISIEDDSVENQTISEHIETCGDCQARLATLDQAREINAVAPIAEMSVSVPQAIIENVSRAVRSANLPTSYNNLSGIFSLEFLAFLDKGGMGDVLVYRDTQLNRNVVLKTLRHDKEQSIQKRKRFAQEKKITSQLRLPGVPEVYGSAELPDGREYFCMQYIEGGKLSQFIRSFHESLPTFRRSNDQFLSMLRIFVTICRTLDSAHQQKIVHRDLKSSNILLGKNNFPYVIDWGLAGDLHSSDLSEETSALESPRLTQKGLKLGTPYSWSPEQASGRIEQLDLLTDIYGLGSILFEILTGKLLHAPTSDQNSSDTSDTRSEETLRKEIDRITQELMNGVIRDPRSINELIPNELASICIRATHPDRAKRYQSAGCLADDIEAWLSCLPVKAHNYSTVEQTQRWITASPSRATSIFLSIVTVAAFAVVFSTISYSLRKKAEINEQRAQAAVRDGLNTLRSVLDIASDNKRPDTNELRSIQKQMVATIEHGIANTSLLSLDESTLIETATLLGRLGDNYSTNAQTHEASRVFETACRLFDSKLSRSTDVSIDSTVLLAELQCKLAQSQIANKQKDEAAETAREGIAILDLIPVSRLAERGKLYLPVYIRRTHALSHYRYWEPGTLQAHDLAVETLAYSDKLHEQWPEDERLNLERAETLAFLGLCVHKSGDFEREMLIRYKHLPDPPELVAISQRHFQNAVDCLAKIPTTSHNTDSYLETTLSILSNKAMSDARVSSERSQETYEQCIDILRKFVDKYPFSRERRIDLAANLSDYADQFYPANIDKAISLRREGLDLLQDYSHIDDARLTNCLTLMTTRYARELAMRGQKPEATQLVREIYDRFGTLHNGLPLEAEFYGYALIFRQACESKDKTLQQKITHQTIEFLKTLSAAKFQSAVDLKNWLENDSECRQLSQQPDVQAEFKKLFAASSSQDDQGKSP